MALAEPGDDSALDSGPVATIVHNIQSLGIDVGIASTVRQ